MLDSGCSLTCVAKHLVSQSEYTGKTVNIKAFVKSAKPRTFPTVRIRLQLSGFDKFHVVAVYDDLEEDALLGVDLGK